MFVCRLVTRDGDGPVCVRDLRRLNEPAHTIHIEHPKDTVLAVSHDGRFVITTGVTSSPPAKLVWTRVADGDFVCLRVIADSIFRADDGVALCAAYPDILIVGCDGDNDVRTWNMHTGALIHDGHNELQTEVHDVQHVCDDIPIILGKCDFGNVGVIVPTLPNRTYDGCVVC